MNTLFHRLIGIGIAIAYTVMWLNLREYFPTVGQGGRKGGGIMIIIMLPAFSACCFLFPSYLKMTFSPRVPPGYSYLFTEGVWYLFGYFSIFVFWGALRLYQSAIS